MASKTLESFSNLMDFNPHLAKYYDNDETRKIVKEFCQRQEGRRFHPKERFTVKHEKYLDMYDQLFTRKSPALMGIMAFLTKVGFPTEKQLFFLNLFLVLNVSFLLHGLRTKNASGFKTFLLDILNVVNPIDNYELFDLCVATYIHQLEVKDSNYNFNKNMFSEARIKINIWTIIRNYSSLFNSNGRIDKHFLERLISEYSDVNQYEPTQINTPEQKSDQRLEEQTQTDIDQRQEALLEVQQIDFLDSNENCTTIQSDLLIETIQQTSANIGVENTTQSYTQLVATMQSGEVINNTLDITSRPCQQEANMAMQISDMAMPCQTNVAASMQDEIMPTIQTDLLLETTSAGTNTGNYVDVDEIIPTIQTEFLKTHHCEQQVNAVEQSNDTEIPAVTIPEMTIQPCLQQLVNYADSDVIMPTVQTDLLIETASIQEAGTNTNMNQSYTQPMATLQSGEEFSKTLDMITKPCQNIDKAYHQSNVAAIQPLQEISNYDADLEEILNFLDSHKVQIDSHKVQSGNDNREINVVEATCNIEENCNLELLKNLLSRCLLKKVSKYEQLELYKTIISSCETSINYYNSELAYVASKERRCYLNTRLLTVQFIANVCKTYVTTTTLVKALLSLVDNQVYSNNSMVNLYCGLINCVEVLITDRDNLTLHYRVLLQTFQYIHDIIDDVKYIVSDEQILKTLECCHYRIKSMKKMLSDSKSNSCLQPIRAMIACIWNDLLAL